MSEYTKKFSFEKETQLDMFESVQSENILKSKFCNPPDYTGPIRTDKLGPNTWVPGKTNYNPETVLHRKFCMCKKFDDGVFCKKFSYCRTKRGGEV